ncbi:MAG: PT domain-containing protein [Candidatus Paceibacterota bacterium]
MTISELRTKHPQFTYRNFSWSHANELLSIEFKFLLEPDISFTSRLTIDTVPSVVIEKIGQKQLDNLVFHLGLIELFSYWKVAAPQKIVIEAGELNGDQLAWWKTLLLRGMGEFFYTNQIDFTAENFVELICSPAKPNSQPVGQPTNQSVNQPTNQSSSQPTELISKNEQATATPHLVPVGGGKDSAVVIELLEANNLPYDILLSYPQSPAAAQIAQLSRATNIIKINRLLDPKLLELNQANYLNGHTPFSARLAFESQLVASLLGHQQILLGNEFSANEGNVPFHGTTVNHQYSKTFEFEQAFRQYAQNYLTANKNSTPVYLSLLRPIFELQIAGIFSQYPRYQSIFRSCNRGQQKNIWCEKCAKCLFVFAILYPFLDEDQLIGPIFSTNLFEDETLNPLALALLGKDEHKPFECVGTYQETLAAFALSQQKFQRLHPVQPLPAVLKFVEENILAHETNLDQIIQETLCFWNDQHHLDEQLVKIVKSAQTNLCQKSAE